MLLRNKNEHRSGQRNHIFIILWLKIVRNVFFWQNKVGQREKLLKVHECDTKAALIFFLLSFVEKYFNLKSLIFIVNYFCPFKRNTKCINWSRNWSIYLQTKSWSFFLWFCMKRTKTDSIYLNKKRIRKVLVGNKEIPVNSNLICVQIFVIFWSKFSLVEKKC